MGRIHRYGQNKDCLIFNFVATNTREGYVLSDAAAARWRTWAMLWATRSSTSWARRIAAQPARGSRSGHRRRDDQGTGRRRRSAATTSTRRPRPERRNCWKARSRETIWTGRPNETAPLARRSAASRPSYFERFFVDAITYAGGKVDQRLDPGTWRVTARPTCSSPRSRTPPAFARSRPTTNASPSTSRRYAVRARRRRGNPAGGGALRPRPSAVRRSRRYCIERTADEVGQRRGLLRPRRQEPTLLACSSPVTWSTATASSSAAPLRRFVSLPTGALEPAPRRSLFDVVPPTATRLSRKIRIRAEADAELRCGPASTRSRQVFQQSKADREHVADIQEDFLKRSFNSLLAQADAAIIAADEEIDAGVQGAEGRLRKAELVKEQHEQRPPSAPRRLASGRIVMRGRRRSRRQCRFCCRCGSARARVQRDRRPRRQTDSEIEQIAVRVARATRVRRRGATVRSRRE